MALFAIQDSSIQPLSQILKALLGSSENIPIISAPVTLSIVNEPAILINGRQHKSYFAQSPALYWY